MILSPLPIQKFFGNNGLPLAGGKLFTYTAGTNTKVATYTDSTGGTPNTNPVILNFRGEANVWFDPTLTYKFVLSPSTDTDPPTNPIWTEDNIAGGLTINEITQQFLGKIIYPRTAAEITAGVTPVNYVYPPGDLRRYGCDVTGATDNSTQIANAILAAVASGGIGYIYHPGGQVLHASTITVPNGVTIYGNDRNACEFTYNGTGNGWNNVNGPNSSGYGKVRFQGLKLTSTNASNAGAAIELNAGGFSYYEIVDCWLYNKWKFGGILDAVELCTIERCIIDLAGTQAGQVGIWIVNGPDRVGTQNPGFSNVITIRDNQISGNGLNIVGACIGLADDGGNGHLITGNNFNGHGVPVRIAGCYSFALINNSLESHAATGGATAQFTNLTLAGVNVGQNSNGVIHANGFFCDQASGNNLIFVSQTYTITAITQAAKAVVTISIVSSANPFVAAQAAGLPVTFQSVVGMTQINGLTGFIDTAAGSLGGSSGAWTVRILIDSSAFTAYASGGNLSHFHAGFHITGNVFGYTVGRTSAIDVQQLANSFCGYNFDLAQSAGMGHYTGVHNDTLGNTLLPPQNGSVVSLGINGPTYGDTRYPTTFSSSIVHKRITVTYSANMALDLRTGDEFYVTPTNGVGFTFTYSNALDGNRFSVTIINTTGGVLGAATWTSFKLGAAWAQPANGFRRTIEFEIDGSGVAHEINRTAADVAN